MAKYDWMASNSAPRGCPMELVSGDFIFPNGGSLYIPYNLIHEGWGTEVSLQVVGDDTKSLPDRMTITLYSILEDKFYRGTFALPHEQISTLFAEGYRSYLPQRDHDTFNAIVAGVAPGGAVAVWVSGIERQVEVFFGHAQEVELDWHATLRMPPETDRKRYLDVNIAHAINRDPLVKQMQAAIPFGLWAAYRTRYAWQPAFEGLASPSVVSRVHYVNGERDYLELPLDEAARKSRRPVPRLMEFANNENAYEIVFDEEEMLAVFPRLARGDAPLEVVISNSVRPGQTLVLVRNARETVQLERAKLASFPARKQPERR